MSRESFVANSEAALYTPSVPNKRAKGKVLLNIAMHEDAIQEMDQALVQIGETNRSKFIRDAIREKLQSMGITVALDSFAAHPRFKDRRKPRANSETASTRRQHQ